MNLNGKIIIVTGGSGLIGKAIVGNIHENGGFVINADLLPGSDLGDFFKCDITNRTSVDNLIEYVSNKYGQIDGLVNNAYPRSIDWGDKFEDVELDSWKLNVDMQLNSCFYIIQKVSEYMKIKSSGSIVNIASIYGVVGNDFSIYENTGGMTSPVAYSAIKGAIINLTRYLASYLGKKSVRVNCVSPGGVLNAQNSNFIAQYSHKVPLGRLANPNEIAPAVTFLLSDASSYITGHNLIVDGGWTSI